MDESENGADRSADRRDNQRRRTRVRVRFWNDELEGAGFTSDVSPNGMFVDTSTRVPVGTRVHLEFQLPGGLFLAEAVVARRRIYPQYARTHFKSGLGMRFLRFDEVIRGVRIEAENADGMPLVDLRDPVELDRVWRKDIKLGGLLVPTDDLPEPESTLRVRLLLPEPHEPLECDGLVLHVLPDLPGVALQLMLADQVRGKISQILKAA